MNKEANYEIFIFILTFPFDCIIRFSKKLVTFEIFKLETMTSFRHQCGKSVKINHIAQNTRTIIFFTFIYTIRFLHKTFLSVQRFMQRLG